MFKKPGGARGPSRTASDPRGRAARARRHGPALHGRAVGHPVAVFRLDRARRGGARRVPHPPHFVAGHPREQREGHGTIRCPAARGDHRRTPGLARVRGAGTVGRVDDQPERARDPPAGHSASARTPPVQRRSRGPSEPRPVHHGAGQPVRDRTPAPAGPRLATDRDRHRLDERKRRRGTRHRGRPPPGHRRSSLGAARSHRARRRRDPRGVDPPTKRTATHA